MFLLPVGRIDGQDIPTRTLGRPEAEHVEPFTALVGIRELPDGRVIVGDRIERTVQVIDLQAGGARQLGREGSGPQEYGIPARIIELRGDSTLIYDSGNARFLLLVAERVVGTLPLETSSGERLASPPSGWDGIGGLYYHEDVYPPGPPAPGRTPERAVITRYDRSTRRVDTVAALALPPGRSQGVRQLEGGMVRVLDNMPMAPEDIAAVAPDGRVAVVRAAPYRVEWIHRDGRRIAGPAIPHTPLRIGDEDKRAHLRRQVRPGNIIVFRNPNASDARAAPIERSGRRIPPDALDIDDPSLTWPTHMPPFLAGAARVAPDGTLWVLRTRAHDDPTPVYDLFDGSGRRTGRVALPRDTRLLGFGKGTVYLIRVDADELQWLQRHRW